MTTKGKCTHFLCIKNSFRKIIKFTSVTGKMQPDVVSSSF